jgi:enolase
MIIKKIYGEKVKDSRGEDTIQVTVKTKKGKFKTASPAGKSTGKYEVKSYAKSLDEDIKEIGKIDLERLNSLSFKNLMIWRRLKKLFSKKLVEILFMHLKQVC